MINILVDEAYAFDYLSILKIKKDKNSQNENAYQENYIFLKKQFSESEWNEMISSKEYENMIEANNLTFDAVQKARYGIISAKEVDDCNMKRFEAKIKFQNKFFPNQKITEAKT
jgi:hypothetical protein